MSFSPELISGLIAFLLTLFVLSYLIGDQILFRATINIFVGASAGYVATVAWHQVLAPNLVRPLLSGTSAEKMLAIIPLTLSLLLLAKAIPPLSKLGTPSVAFMVGTGAAVAIGGAVTGTIFPQVTATINLFDMAAANERGISSSVQFLEGGLMILGTISTLVYFQFTAKRGTDGTYRRNLFTKILSLIGGIFIAITFGVLLAGVYSAALTALIERLDFLISFAGSLWLP
ncbi:MAG: hypothetical protein HN855_00820 [Anaerolineae bacterium]|jgi:hypothetical protein|nr:hypothetical protein [Anaerolineae bacterium]MBT7070801.1 hypothetical protein [Anaerolineae bacterium]MBT7323683.1 hypothetical protein [Anaerolineae bacterium]